MSKKPKNNHKPVEVTKLRALLHGVFNGDPEAEREAREALYGKSDQTAH